MKLFKAKSGNYRTTDSPFGPNKTNEGKEKEKEKGRSKVLFFRCRSSLFPWKQRAQSHDWEQIMTSLKTLLFLYLFLSLEKNHWEKQELTFLEVKTSCISAGSSELPLLQRGLWWLRFDETETSQVGWRKRLFQNPVWCLGSWFLPAETPEPITCCGSRWSRNWVEILWVCDPKYWSLRYLGNYQWRTFHLPAPWLWVWLEKPLFSHPT